MSDSAPSVSASVASDAAIPAPAVIANTTSNTFTAGVASSTVVQSGTLPPSNSPDSASAQSSDQSSDSVDSAPAGSADSPDTIKLAGSANSARVEPIVSSDLPMTLDLAPDTSAATVLETADTALAAVTALTSPVTFLRETVSPSSRHVSYPPSAHPTLPLPTGTGNTDISTGTPVTGTWVRRSPAATAGDSGAAATVGDASDASNITPATDNPLRCWYVHHDFDFRAR
jgi:hypothetical protein